MNIEKLKESLTLGEGRKLAAYLDTEGILTVGIGHNCKADPVLGVEKVGDTITPECCHELFERDIQEKAIDELDRELKWWRDLDDVRQNVMVELCFNMGINTLLTFVNTLHAIETGNYPLAADGMRRSRWARQVGQRAVRLEQMMASGKWQGILD